jgi:hypothetical protein
MLSTGANLKQKSLRPTGLGGILAHIAAWAWTIAAGGGGLWLLWTRGPWPLTNGWFALLSGFAACPLTPWVLKRYAGIQLSVSVRMAAVVFFFLPGKIAIRLGI